MYEGNLRRETRTQQKKSPLGLISSFSIHTQQEYFKMSKARASEGGGDKPVNSELSRGDYATSYDKVALHK